MRQWNDTCSLETTVLGNSYNDQPNGEVMKSKSFLDLRPL